MRARIAGQSSASLRASRRRRRPRRQLRQVGDQRLLRLGALDLGLERALLVSERLDLVLDLAALAFGSLRIRARHEKTARVDRADLELARRIALDANRALNRSRRQILKDERVLALLDLDLGDARHLCARGKHGDGIHARDRLDLGRPRTRGEAHGQNRSSQKAHKRPRSTGFDAEASEARLRLLHD